MSALIVAVASFATALLLTPLVARFAAPLGLIDLPNERSSHHRPTPRGGGIAIVLGIVVGAVLSGAVMTRPLGYAMIAALVVAGIGAVDDARSLRPWPKLIVHLAAASAAVLAAGAAAGPLGAVVAAAAVVWIAWCVNAYNFMDGVNGLAASQAVIAGTAMALLAVARADAPGALLAASIAAAAGGFLPWNFPRARIFMGDVGSTTLGFLFALLALRLSAGEGGWPAAVLPLFPLLFDATLTLVVRMVRGERFFSTAHKQHIYQRLLDLGWTHTRVTLLWGALGLGSGAAALLYGGLAPAGRVVLLTLVGGAHVLLAVIVYWRNGARGPAPTPSPPLHRVERPGVVR